MLFYKILVIKLCGLAIFLTEPIQSLVKNESITQKGFFEETYSLDQKIFENSRYQLSSNSTNYQLVTTTPGRLDKLTFLENYGNLSSVLTYFSGSNYYKAFLVKGEKAEKRNMTVFVTKTDQKDTKYFYNSYKNVSITENIPDGVEFFLFKSYKSGQLVLAGTGANPAEDRKDYLVYFFFLKHKDSGLVRCKHSDEKPLKAFFHKEFQINASTVQKGEFYKNESDGKGMLIFHENIRSSEVLNEKLTNTTWAKYNKSLVVELQESSEDPKSLSVAYFEVPADKVMDMNIFRHQKDASNFITRFQAVYYDKKSNGSEGCCYYFSEISLGNLMYKQHSYKKIVQNNQREILIPYSKKSPSIKVFCLLLNGYDSGIQSNYRPMMMVSILHKTEPKKSAIKMYNWNKNQIMPLFIKKKSKDILSHPGLATDMVITQVAPHTFVEEGINVPSNFFILKHFIHQKLIFFDLVVDKTKGIKDRGLDKADTLNFSVYKDTDIYFRRLNVFGWKDADLSVSSNFKLMKQNFSIDKPSFSIVSIDELSAADIVYQFKTPEDESLKNASSQRIIVNFSEKNLTGQPLKYPASETLLSYPSSGSLPLSSPTEQFREKIEIKLEAQDTFFEEVALSKNNETLTGVFGNTFNNLSLGIEAIKGNNVSFSLKNPPKGVTLLDQRFLPVELKRTDSVTIDTQTDEIFWTHQGAVYEEHSRRLGYLKCFESLEHDPLRVVMKCKAKKSIPTSNDQKLMIQEVEDYTEECQGILVKTKSIQDQKYYFFFYNIKKDLFVNITQPLNNDTLYFFSCMENNALMTNYTRKDHSSSPSSTCLNQENTDSECSSAQKTISKNFNQLISKELGFIKMQVFSWQSKTYVLKVLYQASKKAFKIASITSNDTKSLVFDKKSRFNAEEVRISPFEAGIELDACLFENSYLFYSKNPSKSLKLFLYPGQFYKKGWASLDHSEYHDKYLIDLEKAGYSSFSRIVCHNLKGKIDMFSVVGIRAVKGEAKKTLITTFLAQKNPQGRIYHQMASERVFQEVFIWSDRINYIYLRIKEMKGSKETYRIIIPKPETKLLQVYLKSIDITKDLKLTLSAKNQKKSTNYDVTIKFTHLEVLKSELFNPQLFYKPGSYSLKDLFKSISGSVSEISLKPSDNPAVQLITSRISKPQAFGLPPSATSRDLKAEGVKTQSFPGGAVFFYQHPEKKVILLVFFKNKFVKEIPTSFSETPNQIRVALRSNKNLYILASNSKALIFNLNLETEEFKAQNNEKEVNEAILKSQLYFLQAVDNIKGFPEPKLYLSSVKQDEFHESHMKSDNFTLEIKTPASSVNFTFKEPKISECVQMKSYAKFDQHIQICIYEGSNSKKAIVIFYLHYNPTTEASELKKVMIKPESLTFLESENSVSDLACIFTSHTSIHCVYNFYKDFSIEYKAPADCKEGVLCYSSDALKISQGKGLQKQFDYVVKRAHHSGKFIVLVAVPSDLFQLSTQLKILVYKIGFRSVYSVKTFGTIRNIGRCATGFISEDKFFVAIPDLKTQKPKQLNLFTFSEKVEFKLKAKKLDQLAKTQILIESGTSSGGRIVIPFEKIFKEKVVVVPEETNFFVKYWWVVLLGVIALISIGGLVSWYFVRRARLLKELRMKDDTVLYDLREFHFT